MHAHPFGKIKVHRRIEVCVRVCVLSEFRHFLTLRFQSFVCRSLQKNSDRTRCPRVTVWKSKSAFGRESVLVF